MSWQAVANRHALSVATGALAVVTIVRLGVRAELPAVLVFVVGGMLLATIDWKVHRLPTDIVHATLAGVAVCLLGATVVEGNWSRLATAGAGALVLTGAFVAVWSFGRHVTGTMLIGLGDVRLAAVVGLLLGWHGWATLVAGTAAGNVAALVVAAGISLRDGATRVHYPFGPPLIAGTICTLLVLG